ncbi:MAG: nickel-dependent hydrogenase large subunit [Candidatus Bipolaricaulota bacterium]
MATTIPIGPYHPLQEEPEHYLLTVEGEEVLDVDVQIGYNHRGIEKLSEKKTYNQVPFLVERVCGICSHSHPYAYCLAVEDCGDLEVPEKAKYLRTLIGELERIHSHLLWAGLAGHFIGYDTVFMWAWKYREEVLDLLELLTGNRNAYAMMKPGGVQRDIPRKHLDEARPTLDMLKEKSEMLYNAVLDDPVMKARLEGIGILDEEDARAFGALGPTSRASGIPNDIRSDFPYGVYEDLDWKVITRDAGDVLARVEVRLLETLESIKMCNQIIDRIPDEGSIDSEPKEIPPGDGIGSYEAPRGECFHYIKSDGTNRPVRHKIRAPTFMNFPTYRSTCIGETIADASIILASVDPCYCCTERAISLKGKDDVNLLELSQERTAEIKEELGLELSPLEEVLDE